jgi:MFS superfamily sulfate permease-like transporter
VDENLQHLVSSAQQNLPKDGIAGFLQNWRSDLVAGVSVSLVALPLALGIAIAADLPPISGVISAIVGGIVTTMVRSGHVSINGPANGLIVVLLIAVENLRDDAGVAYPYVLAAGVIAGAIQILMGFLKFGKFGDFFPASVIQGMLAGFGVIIVGKQIHTAFGHTITGTVMDTFFALPESISTPNLPVLIIAAVSLTILIIHSRIKNRHIHFLPAPLWVLIFAVPAAYFLKLDQSHSAEIAGRVFKVGPEFLIRVPANLVDSLVSPDFSRVGEPIFWTVVFTLCFVTSVETILSAKAVDKLDPYNRRTDLNRDLSAVGLSSIVSGFLGGLPVTAVIVRSSVNINHGAQTRWSNFFHGVILLAAVVLFPNFIQEVPLAALAAILIFTGYRLAGPKVFRDALRRGNEQFVLLIFTLLGVLYLGLIQGILAGLLLTMALHWVWSEMAPGEYFRYLVKPDFQLVEEKDGSATVWVRGVASFLNLFWLERLLRKVAHCESVTIDLGKAKLVDTTTQDYLYEQESLRRGKRFEIVGLANLQSSSAHPTALRRRYSPIEERKIRSRLTVRQNRLAAIAESRGWDYDPSLNWEQLGDSVFHFFETRPMEYRRNIIRGRYEDLNIDWEVEDVTFDEGAFLATEEHHTTVQYMRLPSEVPPFSIELRGFLDKLLELVGYKESGFVVYPDVSSEFIIRSLPEVDIGTLISEELLALLHEQPVYHLESNGTALLLFKHDSLAGSTEVEAMVDFSHKLVRLLQPNASIK